MVKKRHKKNGLESKVMKYWTPKDDKGYYIPYCDFRWHRGLIQDESVCNKRQCPHYHKLYIDENSKLY